MNEADKKVKKKGKAFAIAAIFLSAAIWFALLGVFLYNAMLSYKPPPNAVQEGNMVSFFLMLCSLPSSLCAAPSRL